MIPKSQLFHIELETLMASQLHVIEKQKYEGRYLKGRENGYLQTLIVYRKIKDNL